MEKPPFEMNETVRTVSLRDAVAPASASTLRLQATPQEMHWAQEIALRVNRFAASEGLPPADPIILCMDLLALHSNDAPLDLRGMHETPDVGEVLLFIGRAMRTIDRASGRLTDGWRGKFHLKLM